MLNFEMKEFPVVSKRVLGFAAESFLTRRSGVSPAFGSPEILKLYYGQQFCNA